MGCQVQPGYETCTIAGSGPGTLQFVFYDYLGHRVRHLEHIGIRGDELERSAMTADQSGGLNTNQQRRAEN